MCNCFEVGAGFCLYKAICLVWTSRGLQEGFIRAADGLKDLDKALVEALVYCKEDRTGTRS